MTQNEAHDGPITWPIIGLFMGPSWDSIIRLIMGPVLGPIMEPIMGHIMGPVMREDNGAWNGAHNGAQHGPIGMFFGQSGLLPDPSGGQIRRYPLHGTRTI